MKGFVSSSIKVDTYKRLSNLAKKEKHTISDQLDLILVSYVEKTQ